MGQGTSSSRARYGLTSSGSRAEGPSCTPHGVLGLLGLTPGFAVEGLGTTERRLLSSQSGGGGGHSTQPQESPDTDFRKSSRGHSGLVWRSTNVTYVQ